MTDSTLPYADLPKWNEFMLPILEVLSDGRQWNRRPLVAAVLDRVEVPEHLRTLQYGKSGHVAAENRVGWAKSALSRAKLIDTVARGVFEINDEGVAFLAAHRDGFGEVELEGIPAYVEYVPVRRGQAADVAEATPTAAGEPIEEATPEERIQAGLDELEDDLRSQLLTRLRGGDPYFFEAVVRDLVVKMGYGREGEVKKLFGSGDSGIDGVVDRDELGLSRIFIQAKRYAETNAVGRPAIQEFIGALATRGATTGAIFTTSRFTQEAREAAERAPHDVALVDGPRLAEFMIRYRVGVQVERAIEITKVDEDFFA